MSGIGGAEDRPLAGRAFFRGHGLGNDYLVVDEGSVWRLTPAAVHTLCDRHFGVGSDGVVLVHRGETQPFRLRGFNPDGSEFERSGNGLRVVAAHLFRSGRVGSEPFQVEIGGDRVRMQVHSADGRGELDVSVEMGQAQVGPEAVGWSSEAAGAGGDRGDAGDAAAGARGAAGGLGAGGARWADGTLTTGSTGPLAAAFVSVGNPHCVLFGSPDPWGELAAEVPPELGGVLAVHPVFARGINVQQARVRSPDVLEARVWERGVGPTSASGTSACAVAVAAVASGRVPAGEKVVRMPGGELRVTVDAELNVVLRGPVRAVCDGELDAGFCRVLTGV